MENSVGGAGNSVGGRWWWFHIFFLNFQPWKIMIRF